MIKRLLMVLTAYAGGVFPAAVSAQDTIVLGDFENRTGEAVFDAVMIQALTLELGQSPYLNILSDRDVRDTLRRLGLPTNQPIATDVARTICTQTESKAVVSGVISNVSGRYELQLAASSCNGKDILANVRATAMDRSGVLGSLSKASSTLREKLGEPLASVREFGTPLPTITDSVEALKNYSIGIATRRDQGDTPSVPYLKKAIEIDPHFALAYTVLAGIYRNLQQPTVALDYATKAYELRDRGSERQRLQIASSYFLATGQIKKEIQTYERWQAKYPKDLVPRNNLGNDYAALGQLDQALTEYKEALRLTPSVIGYTNVGGMYLSLNRFDDARKTLDDALAHQQDGRYIRQSFYWLAFLTDDAALMEQQVAWASGKQGDEDALLSMQSDTEAYYGRLRTARDLTKRSVDLAVRAGANETAALWAINSALREAELGNADEARQGTTAALALSTGREVTVIAAFTMARVGDVARARQLTTQLEKDYATDTLLQSYWLPCIRAAIDMDEGNPSQALARLQAVEPYEQGGAGAFINYLYPAYLRGQAHLMAHQGAAAAAEFQKLLDHSGIVLNFVTGALARQQLGLAYTTTPDNAAAKKSYENFLALWKEADPDIAVLKRVKAELAHLR